jgi:hypothetical protein
LRLVLRGVQDKVSGAATAEDLRLRLLQLDAASAAFDDSNQAGVQSAGDRNIQSEYA